MSKIIKFHLIDQEFVIFKSDLIKYPSSKLFSIIDSDTDWAYTEDDIVYINRSPDYFKYIAAYLRDELYIEDVNELSTRDIEQLYNEATFYNFPVLMKILADKQNNILIDISDNRIDDIINMLDDVNNNNNNILIPQQWNESMSESDIEHIEL